MPPAGHFAPTAGGELEHVIESIVYDGENPEGASMVVRSRIGNTHLAAIFGRLWEGKAALNPPLARHILNLKFVESDVARMHELAGKNRAGTLTAAEADELDDFVRAADLLAVLQSKARVRLGRTARPAHE